MTRREYEMTEEEMARILEASKPVIAIALHCGSPSSPQANANAAWAALGEEMGFKYMTVRPVHGKAQTFFTAEPYTEKETPDDPE